MSPESIGILKKYQVNITTPRVQILDAFMNARQSLDHQYFLHTPQYKFERSTVFRTLRLFTNKKIIYRLSTNGTKKYIFLPDGKHISSPEEHSSFVCDGCGKAVAVETIAEPKLKIPKGFTTQNVDIIIHGLCPACKT